MKSRWILVLTKIAMSCDRTGKKEIYVMDFDGSDVKQVTHHRSIAFAPAWSSDGSCGWFERSTG